MSLIRLKYGSYAHALGDAAVSIRTVTQQDQSGNIVSKSERWSIQGMLQAADQASLDAAIAALKAAYATNGGTLGLYYESGGPTAHVRDGVRIVSGPDFPIGTGAEHTTYRTYNIELEAPIVIDLSGGNTQQPTPLYSEENFEFSGGGPRFVMLTTLEGPPIKQIIAQATPYRATQAGRAEGAGSWPTIPGPLWSEDEHVEQRVVSRGRPRVNRNGGPSIYPVAWSYTFESANPLVGV